MSAPTDRVVFANLTTATTTTNYEGTTCISIINSGDNSISVEANTGFVNPIIRITTGSGTTDVSVMYS